MERVEIKSHVYQLHIYECGGDGTCGVKEAVKKEKGEGDF